MQSCCVSNFLLLCLEISFINFMFDDMLNQIFIGNLETTKDYVVRNLKVNSFFQIYEQPWKQGKIKSINCKTSHSLGQNAPIKNNTLATTSKHKNAFKIPLENKKYPKMA